MIAFDAVSQSSVDAASSPLAFNHTCTGSNLLLIVGVGASSDVVTGVTYNGVAMTQLIKLNDQGQGYSYIYGLLAPATGVNSISIAWTGTSSVRGIGASYTGVRQSSLPDATNSQYNASTTSLTTTVTTVANTTWAVCVTRATTAIAAGAGQTLRDNTVTNFTLGDSNAAITPNQVYSMTSTQVSDEMGMIIASFADVVQPGTDDDRAYFM